MDIVFVIIDGRRQTEPVVWMLCVGNRLTGASDVLLSKADSLLYMYDRK